MRFCAQNGMAYGIKGNNMPQAASRSHCVGRVHRRTRVDVRRRTLRASTYGAVISRRTSTHDPPDANYATYCIIWMLSL